MSTGKNGVILKCTVFSVISLSATASGAAELALQLETALRSDSNPLRYYDNKLTSTQGETIPNSFSGDTVTSASVRAGVIVPLASDQTRLILTGSLGGEHFKDYSQLNHRESAADASLEVSVLNNLFIQAHTGYAKKLFQYLNGSITDRDLVKSQQNNLNAGWKINNDWQFNTGVFRNQTSYELAVNQLYNNHENGGQFFVRYQAPTGSSVQAGLRRSSTDYTDRTDQQFKDLDRGFKENELAADIDWAYSVKTAIGAHVGKIRREYDLDGGRNTYLTNIVLRGTYFFTPALRFDLQLYDRPYSLIDPAIQYVTATGQRLDLGWTYSPKWKMNASYLHQNSEQHLIDRVAGVLGYGSRHESLQRFGLGATWQFDQRWKLVADGYTERAKRDDGLKQSNRIFSLAMQYSFENQTGATEKLRLGRYQQRYSAVEGQ